MRGTQPKQPSMLALVSIESLVPERHPIRAVKQVADKVLKDLSPLFDRLYAKEGRPSVPPERLLKAVVLMALFSVRSERMFCEQLRYNMLFRWFLDMDMVEQPFDATTFTHNRDRLLNQEVAREFLQHIVAHAKEKDLASSEHFSVDGTLIEAWASMKSFRPKDDDSDDNNGFGDFKGTKRSNDTHESKTDPDAKLLKKGAGREAKLCFVGNVLMENRHGLIMDTQLETASGTAERDGALAMLRRLRAATTAKTPRRVTVSGDKAYDTKDFIRQCRELRVTPHVAQNITSHRGSGIDGRSTRHPGYAMSQRARMLIEKIFGWGKTIGGMRRTRFRGKDRTSAAFTFTAAAYDLLRVARLELAV